jgi:hypothetical protein
MGVSVNVILRLVSLPFPQLVSHDTVHQCRCEYSTATEPLTPQAGPSLRKKKGSRTYAWIAYQVPVFLSVFFAAPADSIWVKPETDEPFHDESVCRQWA